MKGAPETFSVYCAGETLDGTDIAMTYVYVTKLVADEYGRVRLTNEEARGLGNALVAAAEYNLEPEDE